MTLTRRGFFALLGTAAVVPKIVGGDRHACRTGGCWVEHQAVPPLYAWPPGAIVEETDAEKIAAYARMVKELRQSRRWR